MQALNKKTIEDINSVELDGKRVLVRCDFNVPITDGKIDDDKRIVESLPTIKYLLGKGAKVILCSHLGRPKGGFEQRFSLSPIAERLSELLGKKVVMAKDTIGEDAKSKAAALDSGEAMLIENVRFHPEEEKNDPGFSKALADLADIYVNDAFGTAHRAHSSTAGVAAYLPAYAGYLIAKEISVMGGALENPERPFIAILGGAKVSDKIGVIKNLIDKVDAILIGGAMAYTFMKSIGGKIGKSLCEDDKLELAKELLELAESEKTQIYLPVDHVAADGFSNEAHALICEWANVPYGWEGLDIGPKTVKLYSDIIKSAKTVIWNGPMGVFEFDNFAHGTKNIAKAVAESGAVSIIGGGDSAAAVEKLGYADKVTHISTGGGAALEFLEGLELPGIACLLEK
ncbi:MAG: phosphoglycerate kinase [Oscillospiraceae bacterium]|nr:phosphoglycerate kinase [Oscillospiraceae bacterium]